jgi:hypothetical protein
VAGCCKLSNLPRDSNVDNSTLFNYYSFLLVFSLAQLQSSLDFLEDLKCDGGVAPVQHIVSFVHKGLRIKLKNFSSPSSMRDSRFISHHSIYRRPCILTLLNRELKVQLEKIHLLAELTMCECLSFSIFG